eukprot:gnl/TRDRNA2_/TRDRNA2_183722_c0_seq1.p1 gnl/TRDRNA2_/TRDRNA2_183722_c0~~gnl/TRDRNA2_/TRDRNA2_183722_c0_seq1.p1  ORF type:complete len:268 (-),score=57.36 gnl/TRDRNA2_/TRDRNA2_183722_c0_seq1:67-870(-)
MAAEEQDLVLYLEQKKKEVAAVQELADIAKEQALVLLRTQRRMNEIDAMANGQGSSAEQEPIDLAAKRGLKHNVTAFVVSGERPPREAAEVSDLPPSSLSPEDRERFGLDPGQGRKKAMPIRPTLLPYDGGMPVNAGDAADVVVPKWSSLSAADRLRFGLEGASSPRRDGASGRSARSRAAGDAAIAGGAHTDRYPADRMSMRKDQFALHPDVLWGGSGGSVDAQSPAGPVPSMSKTIAQLEAVGVTKHISDIRESERRLQLIKMRG